MSNENPIIIVSGLPRSGTSLMMNMLEAGGLKSLVDNIRKPDKDNPKGYYEFEKVKKTKKDSLWLKRAKGRVVKIISMLLYDLPKNYRYKVIFMERDLEEIIRSQNKMLAHRKKESSISDKEIKTLYEKHLEEVKAWLNKKDNFDVLSVSYNDFFVNADENINKIISFLDVFLNSNK